MRLLWSTEATPFQKGALCNAHYWEKIVWDIPVRFSCSSSWKCFSSSRRDQHLAKANGGWVVVVGYNKNKAQSFELAPMIYFGTSHGTIQTRKDCRFLHPSSPFFFSRWLRCDRFDSLTNVRTVHFFGLFVGQEHSGSADNQATMSILWRADNQHQELFSWSRMLCSKSKCQSRESNFCSDKVFSAPLPFNMNNEVAKSMFLARTKYWGRY